LIKPPEGWGVAYLDASAQEVWLAAVLSGDQRMLEDYFKDIYIQFAIASGEAPPGASKQTHPDVRNDIKPLVLAGNYGQSPWGLAKRLHISEDAAKQIQNKYRNTYPRFHRWRQGIVNGLALPGRTYHTKLGWPFWTGNVRNARSMMNFPLQAHGSDWMRAVAIAATEAGIEVCAAVHDGFLIAAPCERLTEDINRMSLIMRAAGEAMFGVPMLVELEQEVRWPNRFDPGDEHRPVWELVQRELAEAEIIRAGFAPLVYPRSGGSGEPREGKPTERGE
jgi:DNA polymerase I-like protein with 3'-5' exonuclease and polymerase domains